MHRTLLSALAGSFLVMTLAACGGGGGDSTAEVKAKVATEIAKGGLSKKDSECFAGVLVKEIGVKKLKGVDFSASAPPKGLQNELTAASVKAIATCKIDVTALNK